MAAIGSTGAVGVPGIGGFNAMVGVASTPLTADARTVTGTAAPVPAPTVSVNISAAGRSALDADTLRSSLANLTTNNGIQGANGNQGLIVGTSARTDNGTAVANSTVNTTVNIGVINASGETIALSDQTVRGLLQSMANAAASGGTLRVGGSVSFGDLISALNSPLINTGSGVATNEQAVALLLLALLFRQLDNSSLLI